jgi:hypothetical protein
MIRSLFDFLGLHHAESRRSRPIAPEFSPIGKLPHELILLIASNLPLESAANLSLSCHSLYSCLETQHLKSLKGADYSVINGFLRVLERDLPSHILCPHCNKLYSMSFAGNHLPSQRYYPTRQPWLACWREDLESDVKIGIHRDFSSTVFRMAMKSHREGHDTTEILGLLLYRAEIGFQRGFVEQRAAAARIQDGSLLMREQRVFIVPCSQKIPLPWKGGIDICPHIQFATMLSLHMFGIQIPLADEIIGKYENRQRTIYCEYCYTEFRVDFKSFGKDGNAMFVTRWMDIGDGQDILDNKWRSRLGCLKGKT